MQLKNKWVGFNDLRMLLCLIILFFVACKAVPIRKPITFEVKPYYFNKDSTLVYFEFGFRGHQKEIIVFDWFNLVFGQYCIDGLMPQKMNNNTIESLKNCPKNTLIIENSQGIFNTFDKAFSSPAVGPYAGKLIKNYPEKIKDERVKVGEKQTFLRSPSFPIEVLYPEKGSKKVRFHYSFGKNKRKQILTSDWFDVLPLPYHYRK